jgi:hypothetical protein
VRWPLTNDGHMSPLVVFPRGIYGGNAVFHKRLGVNGGRIGHCCVLLCSRWPHVPHILEALGSDHWCPRLLLFWGGGGDSRVWSRREGCVVELLCCCTRCGVAKHHSAYLCCFDLRLWRAAWMKVLLGCGGPTHERSCHRLGVHVTAPSLSHDM